MHMNKLENYYTLIMQPLTHRIISRYKMLNHLNIASDKTFISGRKRYVSDVGAQLYGHVSIFSIPVRVRILYNDSVT